MSVWRARASLLTVPALLGALSVLFFPHLTLGGQVLFWGMPLLQFYPWRTFAVAEYLAGRVPLWNPYSGFGMPLAANLQSGVFYPLNFYYLLLPVERAQTVTLVLHVALAGCTMYGLARHLRLDRAPALVAGVAYMFSGFMVAQGNFHNITSVLAWVPALFWGVEALLTAPKNRARAHAVTGLAIAVALLLTGGFIQYAYYALLAAVAYTLYRTLQLTAGNRLRPRLATVVRLGFTVAAALALGVMLAAVQLLPTAELTRYSVRQSGLGYDDATSASLWPGMVLTVVAPGLFGGQPTNDWRAPGTPWEGVLFLGALPLVAGIMGARSRHPQRRFFVALAAAGLFLALGRYNPLFGPLFTYVPALSLFHAPARFAVWWVVAVPLLAGMGLQALRHSILTPDAPHPVSRLPQTPERPAPTTSKRPSTVAALRLVTAGGLVLTAFGGVALIAGSGVPGAVRAGWSLAAGGLWLAAAPALLLAVGRLPADVWGGGLVAFTALNLFAAGHDLVPGTDARLYTTPPDAGADRLRAAAGLDRTWVSDSGYLGAQLRYFNFTGFWVTDLLTLLQARDQLMPNLGMPAGLYEVHNYDPLRLARPTQLEGLAEAAGYPGPLLDLMGVRFLPAESGVAASLVQAWDAVGAMPVQERAGRPLPRALVVPAAERVGGAEAAVAALSRPDFDPRAIVVLEASTSAALPRATNLRAAEARITTYGPQRLGIETAGGGGVLLVTDAHYPGWRAWVDGAPADIYPADLAFRGILLPDDDQPHTVEMRYEPNSLTYGVAVSAAGLVAVLAVAVYGFPPRRRERA